MAVFSISFACASDLQFFPFSRLRAGARSGKVVAGFPSDRAPTPRFRSRYQVRYSDLIVIYVPDRADEGVGSAHDRSPRKQNSEASILPTLAVLQKLREHPHPAFGHLVWKFRGILAPFHLERDRPRRMHPRSRLAGCRIDEPPTAFRAEEKLDRSRSSSSDPYGCRNTRFAFARKGRRRCLILA